MPQDPTFTDTPPPIATALEAWTRIRQHAGVETALPSARGGRDQDLPGAVLEVLLQDGNPARARHLSLERLLADPAASVSVEELILAVLGAIKPYGLMMKSILKTLAQASAQASGDSIRLQFQFDEHSGPFVDTLENFRETAQRVVRVLDRTQMELPPANLLWKTIDELRTQLGLKLSSWPDSSNDTLADKAEIRCAAHAGLESLAGTLTAAVNEVRRFIRQHGNGRAEAHENLQNKHSIYRGDPALEKQIELARVARDFPDVAIHHLMSRVVDAVERGQLDGDAIHAALKPVVDEFPRRDEWLNQTLQELLDILNLPVWERRHELYSVWVGCQLLQQAQRHADSFEFNTPGRTLSFAFRGSMLGRYQRDGESFEIWAEKRSKLARKHTLSTRSKEIQPDFRVMKADAADADANKSTVMVLEVKHYLRSSTSNFAEAVNDYARSCTQARVILVNYGPVNEDRLRSAVEKELEDRVCFVGEEYPREAGAADGPLGQAIRDTLFPPRPPQALAPAALPGQVCLHWWNGPQDLDLRVRYTDLQGTFHVVSYRSQAEDDSALGMKFMGDIRSGPGQEQIVVSRWLPGSYTVSVEDFNGHGLIRHDTVRVEIQFRDVTLRINPAAEAGSKKFWKVCRIDGATGLVTIHNEHENSELI